MLGVGFSSRSFWIPLDVGWSLRKATWLVAGSADASKQIRTKTTWNTDRDRGIYRKQVQHNYKTFTNYCWWLKSCTTWDVRKPYDYLPYQTGEFTGFLSHQPYHPSIPPRNFHIWPGRSWWRKRYKCQLKCPDHVHCQMTQVPPNGVADWSFNQKRKRDEHVWRCWNRDTT